MNVLVVLYTPPSYLLGGGTCCVYVSVLDFSLFLAAAAKTLLQDAKPS